MQKYKKNDHGELIIHAENAAQALVEKLKAHSYTLAVAESCTAGLISAYIANISGASQVLWGSFICYTKEAKISMLDIDSAFFNVNDLATRETSLQMAAGALKKSGADIAAAITGVAGPMGDGSNVKIGTVWISTIDRKGVSRAVEYHFPESRNILRIRAAIAALELIYGVLT